MKVAFLGLGNMGLPMARNLVKAGHDVTVWNRTQPRAEQVEGAKVSETPGESVRDADAAFTMLSDDAALESVVFGENGILQALPRNAVHISSSTISVALSQRLSEQHRAHGHHYVAAPVFGRPEAAEQAKLFVVAAG